MHTLFLARKLLLKWTGQNDLPGLKNAKYIFIHIHTKYFIYTIYRLKNGPAEMC